MLDKAVKVLIAVFVVYMGMHLTMFALNAPYRNRFDNEAYRNGEVQATYYSFF